MPLDFDFGTDSRNPISIPAAIDRGRSVVIVPVYTITAGFAGLAVIAGIVTANRIIGFSLILVGFVAGWLWWSYSVPRWRHWALSRGADPGELQQAGEQAKLLWPRGHVLEKTEFRFRGSRSAV